MLAHIAHMTDTLRAREMRFRESAFIPRNRVRCRTVRVNRTRSLNRAIPYTRYSVEQTCGNGINSRAARDRCCRPIDRNFAKPHLPREPARADSTRGGERRIIQIRGILHVGSFVAYRVTSMTGILRGLRPVPTFNATASSFGGARTALTRPFSPRPSMLSPRELYTETAVFSLPLRGPIRVKSGSPQFRGQHRSSSGRLVSSRERECERGLRTGRNPRNGGDDDR